MKKTKDLYTENCKTLLKDINEDTNNWKQFLSAWIEKLYSVKMSVLSKAMYRFNRIPIKISVAIFFFSEVEKVIQKFIWNLKKPQIAKTTLNKRNKEIGWCPHIS